MAKIGCCEKCGEYGVIELHHIVFKSKCKILKDCELNHIYLCGNCHRGSKVGVHMNAKEDKAMKLKLQEKLFELFPDEKISLDEVKNVLKLNDKEIYYIYKNLYMIDGKVKSEDLVRSLMGGKLIIE